jgi:MarR family 2-MHQ and catechol resistance regulon transcriptional repressor
MIMAMANKEQTRSRSSTDEAGHRKMRKHLDFPEVQSWRALMSAFRSIFSELEKGLMAEGCSVSRFQILFYLYFEGDLAAIEIARILLVTRGNISMFLRRMESDGLIKKSVPEGQKRPLFTLTLKGRRFFEKVFPPHIERVRQLAPIFGPATLKKLTTLSKAK